MAVKTTSRSLGFTDFSEIVFAFDFFRSLSHEELEWLVVGGERGALQLSFVSFEEFNIVNVHIITFKI